MKLSSWKIYLRAERIKVKLIRLSEGTKGDEEIDWGHFGQVTRLRGPSYSSCLNSFVRNG